MIIISKDKSKLQLDVIHQFITTSYWAIGRSKETIQKTIDHCLCFGVYKQGQQIGFARVSTDYAVFAYLMDVFILPGFQGKGYAKQLMQHIIHDPELKTCTVWMLKTTDAHGLYKQVGFTELKHPNSVMERILN